MIERKYTGVASKGADVVANPTLDGSEQALNSIQINGENFKIEGGREVLTLDDINPEIIGEHPEVFIRLNDRDYNNTHIVIDWQKVLEYHINSTDVIVYLTEKTKNCTIQIINIPQEANRKVGIFGGKTISIIPPFVNNNLITSFDEYFGIDFFSSYLEENIENKVNAFTITQAEEINNNIISMIADVDVFGNVVVKTIHAFEY